MKRFTLLITNNENSPYIKQEDGYLSIIISSSKNISEAVACLTEKPTHIYYDLEHGLSRGQYENKVQRVRAVCKHLFPNIPALKAELFLTKQEKATMQDNKEFQPTTSEPKTTQIVYAFAHQYSATEEAFLSELGKQEGVYLQVFKQQAFSEDSLGKLLRGMSVPVLALVFSVNDEQKAKIAEVFRRTDVNGIATVAEISPYPLFNDDMMSRVLYMPNSSQKMLEVLTASVGKNFQKVYGYADQVNAVAHSLSDDNLSNQLETAPMVYEFEEAISLIKSGDVAMRPLHSPVDSFVSKTDGSQLPSNKFWSRFNKAVAEKRPGKTLKVNSSFTKFLGGMDGVTMGWVPTNEDMWAKWVMEGTALYPTHIRLEDFESLYIRYDLYRGRGVLDDVTKFAGPFNLAYDTIFPAIRNQAKVGFLTNNEDTDVADFDRKLITLILNDMINFHEDSTDEFVHSNIVVTQEDADAQPYFVVEHTVNIATDKKYAQESAALWNELKEQNIEVLIVDLDAFSDHALKDDILKQLNWLSEQQDNFTWVALSIEEDIEIIRSIETVDLGDAPEVTA